MEPMTAMAIAQGGIGLIQTVGSAFGTAKANSELKQNSKLRPTYRIQKPILDNQAIAESRASRGLSDRTLNNYNTFTERNLTATLDAALKGGSAMNNIGDVFGAAEDSERKLAILDDEMNARNVRELMVQNREMGGELDKAFQFNEYAPWADKQKAIMAKLQKNQEGLNNGINTMVGAATNYVTANQYGKEIDNVYGPKTSAGSAERIQEANKIMSNLNQMLEPGQDIDASGPNQSSIQDQIRSQYPGLSGGMWG